MTAFVLALKTPLLAPMTVLLAPPPSEPDSNLNQSQRLFSAGNEPVAIAPVISQGTPEL